uniref:G-protein coupled receptors family 1 profile domain-containing protein n=1 Tax=Cavia porcellus TaxID=10141 RepID=H0W5Q1_CAVPO
MLLSDRNKSGITFILLGFSDYPKIQVPLFMTSLLIYSVIVVGNIGMMVIIRSNPKLHTSMYAFCYSVPSWCWGHIQACSLILPCSALQLSFHGCNIINHFSLLSLSFSMLLIILLSYDFIAVTILKMPSASGRRKAFSTCVSHMTAITILDSTILFLYCVPNSKKSRHTGKVASVFYTVVIPTLNPLICSLRNKDVKDKVQKIMDTKMFSS